MEPLNDGLSCFQQPFNRRENSIDHYLFPALDVFVLLTQKSVLKYYISVALNVRIQSCTSIFKHFSSNVYESNCVTFTWALSENVGLISETNQKSFFFFYISSELVSDI